MKNSYRIVLGIMVVLGAVAGWQLQGKTHQNLVEENTTQTHSEGWVWQTGLPQRYQLTINSSMSFRTTAAQLNQDMQVKLQAALDTLALNANGTEALVGMRLSDLALTISGQSDPEMNAMLQKPFRVHFVAGGVPQTFEFSEGLTAQEQSLLKNIITTFTVSMPETKAEWSSYEQQASGSYQAHYQQLSSHAFKKSKHYFVASSSSPMLAKAIIESEENFAISAGQNWLSSMQVEESLMTQATSDPVIAISNYASLSVAKGTTANLSSHLWNFTAAAPVPLPNQQTTALTQMTPAQMRQKLLTHLQQLDVALQGRSQQIHHIKDLLQVDASMPTVLLEQLQTQNLDDRTRADLYLALELAGTVESQAALTSVIANPQWSSRDALRATVALAGISNPSPQTLEILWQTTISDNNQLAATAAYTLGSMGSRMNEDNHPDYLTLRNELLSNANSSHNAQQRASYIYALGNTRDPEVVVDMANFLDDQQPAVRQAAAKSLGLMPSQEAADMLISRFNNEASSAVRGAMAESLTTLPLEDASQPMAAMNQMMFRENDEKTRLSMVAFMAKNLDRYPQYKTNLQALARQEPSKRIRQTINEALASQ